MLPSVSLASLRGTQALQSKAGLQAPAPPPSESPCEQPTPALLALATAAQHLTAWRHAAPLATHTTRWDSCVSVPKGPEKTLQFSFCK